MNNYAHQIISDDTRLQLSFSLICSNNASFPLHWHSHLEIMLIRQGYIDGFHWGTKIYPEKRRPAGD